MRFEAVVDPPAELIESIGHQTPRSPFNSTRFALAARSWGAQACALRVASAGATVGGALALRSGGRWNRQLTIPTAPSLPEPEIFWDGVVTFCRASDIAELQVNSYASDARHAKSDTVRIGESRTLAALPLLHRHPRYEYVLPLEGRDPISGLTSNHDRNVKRALSAALKIRRSHSAEHAASHLGAMRASMTRRIQLGENVELPNDEKVHRALLETRAGELFQATSHGDVLASILVISNETSAYYHSAGTTPAGRSCGASTFLVLQTARELATQGVRWFNLGGAGPEAAGLRRFKHGFGAEEVALEAARFSLTSGYRRTLRKVAAVVWRASRKIAGRGRANPQSA